MHKVGAEIQVRVKNYTLAELSDMIDEYGRRIVALEEIPATFKRYFRLCAGGVILLGMISTDPNSLLGRLLVLVAKSFGLQT